MKHAKVPGQNFSRYENDLRLTRGYRDGLSYGPKRKKGGFITKAATTANKI
jgi:hypothetical protein